MCDLTSDVIKLPLDAFLQRIKVTTSMQLQQNEIKIFYSISQTKAPLMSTPTTFGHSLSWNVQLHRVGCSSQLQSIVFFTTGLMYSFPYMSLGLQGDQNSQS